MTSRIAREEGIFAGNSAGSAMAGLLQLAPNFAAGELVVVIFHDHGTRYLGKMYNPDWMREKGYLDHKGLTAKDLVADRKKARLVTIERSATVASAAHIMTAHAYSQIPVVADGRLVGSVNEGKLFDQIVRQAGAVEGAGRGHHGAGPAFRRHLGRRRSAGRHDDPGLAGRAGARLQERRDLHHHALGRDQGAQLMKIWLVAALLVAAAASAIAQPAADLRLVEAIGWYTGTRGLVDDAKARTLIETAAFEGNVLARMWLARMYSVAGWVIRPTRAAPGPSPIS